mmetsp:Transcript_1660/g.2740  ORF Transcript_1660/g.2740 Transcript_1660/m.2740 type:complete len:93 (-) Transcript_1660:135-413(-)
MVPCMGIYKPGDGETGENEEERESTIGPFGIDKKIGTAPHILATCSGCSESSLWLDKTWGMAILVHISSFMQERSAVACSLSTNHELFDVSQ